MCPHNGGPSDPLLRLDRAGNDDFPTDGDRMMARMMITPLDRKPVGRNESGVPIDHCGLEVLAVQLLLLSPAVEGMPRPSTPPCRPARPSRRRRSQNVASRAFPTTDRIIAKGLWLMPIDRR